MKIEYVVMQGDPRGTQEPFDLLPIDNSFDTEDAAEAAIENYFNNESDRLLGDSPILFVLKVFKKNH